MIGPHHIDEFAGGGGAGEGFKIAMGREASLTVNHNPEAVGMNRMNHQTAQHFCQDVFKVDPIDALKLLGYSEAEIWRAAGVVPGLREFLIASGWFSPDCKHFSKAKGAALLDKRIRGLVWIILKWVGRGGLNGRRGPACPGVVFMENVEEFKTFGPLVAARCPKTGRVIKKDGTVAAPGEHVRYWDQRLVPDKKRLGLYFKRFVRWLESFGAVVEWRELRACDYGAPTIRQRLFLIARFDGQPIAFPVPTHGDPSSAAVLAGQLKPWPVAADCIDFDLPCPSVFLTRRQAKRAKLRVQRPLANDSHHRLAWGVKRFVMDAAEPFIVDLTHRGGFRGQGITQPFRTITGANRGEKALVSPELAAPFVTYGQHGGASRDVRDPMHTITASKKDTNLLASAFMVKMRGNPASHPPGQALDQPLGTISAGGQHHGVVVAHLAQHNTGMVGHAMTESLSTISGKGCQQAVVFSAIAKYYGTEQAPEMRQPMHTVTTKDRFALLEASGVIPPLTPDLVKKAHRVARWLRSHGVEFEGEFAMCGDYVIVGVGMRMLTPRELYRAQGFPESYIIDRAMMQTESGAWIEVPLSRTAQIRMVGNSVSPPVAAALIAANLSTPTFEKLAA